MESKRFIQAKNQEELKNSKCYEKLAAYEIYFMTSRININAENLH